MQRIKKIYLDNKEIINYLIFGLLTTIVSLVSKYLLLFTILDAANPLELQVAIIISWICACLFAYITNRIYVFESKSRDIIKEMLKFFISRLATLGVEMFLMFILVTVIRLNTDMWVVISTLITQVLIIILNYILSKLIVFRNKKKEEKIK